MTPYVLFVDDEPENLDVFEASCADHFAVLTARSGVEALALMRTHEVAVLLADQRMPLMTGLELLERAQAEYPQIVRMIVTAYSDLDTAIDAINRGRVRRYLRKPWDLDELIATIAEGVEFYQMRNKLAVLERRLAETERVYALGVITSGLARELENPVTALCQSIARARALIRPSTEAPSTDSRAATWRKAELLGADAELGEAELAARRLLTVTRGVELPSGPSERESADASEVTRLTLRLMQRELRELKSLELDCKSVPPVAASAAQVGHVAMNLLLSALAALSGVPPERRKIALRLFHDDRWVCLELGDSGPLLDDDVPRDFDPLKRPESARGYGMGLAIVKAIIQEVRGRLDAKNTTTGVVYRAYFQRSDRTPVPPEELGASAVASARWASE